MKKAALYLSALFLTMGTSSFAKQIAHVSQEGQEGVLDDSSVVSMRSVKDAGLHATESSKLNAGNLIDAKTSYLPYLQIGGAKFINLKQGDWAGSIDAFVPIWQSSPSHLVFTHLRFFDRTYKPFEGNLHIGYRYLSEDQSRLHGIYAAFDRNRSVYGNDFNQLTFGIENWFDEFFIGANYYQPIGKKSRSTGVENETSKFNDVGHLLMSADYRAERAAVGFDGEVGYEFIPGLTAYVGGYYFKAKDLDSVSGPKAKLTYDYSLDNGKRILGVFDKLGLEAGVQHDKPRGTVGYVGINIRVGLLPYKESNLKGVSRHMVDLVRRDVDIVTNEGVVERREEALKDKDGKVLVFKSNDDNNSKVGTHEKVRKFVDDEPFDFESPHTGKKIKMTLNKKDVYGGRKFESSGGDVNYNLQQAFFKGLSEADRELVVSWLNSSNQKDMLTVVNDSNDAKVIKFLANTANNPKAKLFVGYMTSTNIVADQDKIRFVRSAYKCLQDKKC